MGGMLGGSSGKKQKVETSTTTTNVPAYAKPYHERLLARAEALSNTPYQPYTGQRVADFNDDQNAYFSGIRSMSQGPGLSDPSTIQRFMNPYITNVLDRQKDRATQLYNEQQGDRNRLSANNAAFGGSGKYVRDMMAQEAMNRQLGDIDAQGYYDAWNNATGLAQLDQTMNLQRLDALQGSGSQQQARSQAGLDMSYEDYQRQQEYQKDQLNFMSGIMTADPYAKPGQTTSKYTPAPNAASQVAGSATGIAGLARSGVV